MRSVLGRLVAVLIFWGAFLHLFVEPTKGEWKWTVGVIGAFLFAEGVGKLALWIYLKRGRQEPR